MQTTSTTQTNEKEKEEKELTPNSGRQDKLGVKDKNTPVIGDRYAGRITLKVPEAAEVLGINAHSLRRLISRGEIKVVRALRHPLISVEELKRFVTA